MFALLLDSILLVFLIPGLLVAMYVMMLADIVSAFASSPMVVAALTFFGFAVATWSHMTPDPSVPWNSMLDVVAQSHVAGVPLPYLAVVLGLACVGGSLVLAARRTA